MEKFHKTGENPNGFRDGTNTDDDYSYDDQGNMTLDKNKRITGIVYNHLNLPIEIEFEDSGKINYIYNAVGQKLSKVVGAGNIFFVTDYLDGFQYLKEDTAAVKMLFFPHAEGYVNTTGGNNYVFNYTDHLGNIRLSYTQDPTTQVLTILEENHYYPYGLKHKNYNMAKKDYVKTLNPGGSGLFIEPVNEGNPDNYNYKYNGKEYQNDFELNMTAMDMRMFDSAIARWVVQDPVVHHFQSPYNGFDGNPVYWADPSGADADNSTNRFDYDGLGRARYDEHGWYIDPTRRGQARPDVLEMLAAIDKVSGGGVGKVISSNEMGSWIRTFIGNKDVNVPIDKTVYDINGLIPLTETIIIPMYSYEFVPNTRPIDDFMYGFLNAPQSNLGSSSAITGYVGMLNDKNHYLVKGLLMGSSAAVKADYSKFLNVSKSIGTKLGVIGIGVTVIEDIANNNFNLGTVTKVAIGLGTMALGPFGLLYAAADVYVGVTTGTSITDRIANGVQNVYDRR